MDVKINKSKELNKINNITNINNNEEHSNEKYTYSYYDYIDITLGDPISSIFLNDNYIIIGTMTGRIKLFSLNSKNNEIFIISSTNLEHISGLSFNENENLLFASVGDEQILKYEIREPLSNNLSPGSSINIYESSYAHNFNCDNSYVLMSTDSLLKINIFLPETEQTIKDIYIHYEVITFNNQNKSKDSKFKGKIKSTNYYVPLDFDGYNFCWVEYLNDKKDRNLCVQLLLEEETIDKVNYKFFVDKNYGHISHAKLFDDKIFIVHDLNKCEIRKISNKFEFIESFIHIGDEVYAVDILYHETNTFCNGNDINKISIKKNMLESYAFKEDHIYKVFNDEKLTDIKDYSQKVEMRRMKKYDLNKNKKFKFSNSNELKTDSLSLLKKVSNKKKHNEYNQIISIITLDIDGNVNKYENEVEEKLFNLYEIKGIYQDHKDKKFFNMGYVYYIKTDLDFFCISTDHGCYIIKRNEQ